jgi:nitrite reductase/ring-hydroxylating ferredoxin subunit
MPRVRIGQMGDVPAGEGRVIDVDGRALALFNVDGTHYAVDNGCPHRGGPPRDSDLDGTFVACPWHGWRWDVKNGASATPAVPCFPVTVEHGEIFVDLP